MGVRHGNAENPDGRSSHYFKREDHKPDCRFDLQQRGARIAAASKETVVRRDGQWRLKCPPLEGRGSAGSTRRPPGPARPPTASGGGGRRATSDLAGPAIASARRIVQLLEDFEHDAEALAEFAATAPNGKRNIPWDRFCYGRAGVHTLAQALIDGTASAIPHAVWGPASMADAVAGKTGETYVVQYAARHPVTIQGKQVQLRIALRSTDPDWIAADYRSGKFLGYGYWRLFPADLAQAAARGWIELQLWADQPWQVERWDLDATPSGATARRARSPRPPRRPMSPRTGNRPPAAGPAVPPVPAPAPAPPVPPQVTAALPATAEQTDTAQPTSPHGPDEPRQPDALPPATAPQPQVPAEPNDPPFPPPPAYPPSAAPAEGDPEPSSAIRRWLGRFRRP
ncbi:hypothetical protein ACFY1P_20175 [Streptomyces sp. NPDC001407]|uniref:hypothetical protein n=1 Tax=Streptomyces sp. NPDC001407 TaxID=3364573 RepID=UPI00369C917B